MAWTIVGATQNNGTGTNSLSVNKPAGAANGDYALANVSYWDNLTLTPPSGWTFHDSYLQAGAGTSKMAIYKKALGGSEPSSYSWGLNAADDISVSILVVRNQDATTPINTTGAIGNNASGTSATSGSVTPTVNGALLVYLMSVHDNGTGSVASVTVTPPSGYTEQSESSGNAYEYTYIATKVQATAATESPSGTLSASHSTLAVVIALQESAAAPSAPTLSTATAGNAQVSLTWTSSAGATGYKVKRGTSTGTYTTTVDVGNVTSYTATGLTNGTPYYFVVCAYNGAGDGSNSNELNATPTSSSAPNAPVFNSLVGTSTQLTATWSTVPNATGYKVKRGTSTGTYTTTVDVGNVTTYNITGLTNGTRYYVVVVPYNAVGDGGTSNELNAAPSASSFIKSKYNDISNGDILLFEQLFEIEAMTVGTHPSPDSGKIYKSVTVNGINGFEFAVTRNVDGTGKNTWAAGSAYVNTGQAGNGFIDQYSYTSVSSRPFEFISDGTAQVDPFSIDFTVLTSTAPAYFGVANTKWENVFLNITTPAVYTSATIVYEYWNGAWVTLSSTVSATSASNAPITADLKTVGRHSVVFTAPSDWAATTVAGQSAYWIRMRVSASSGWTQNPKHGGNKWATRGKRQYGSTIAFMRRNSAVWNDFTPRAAVGNLEGYYDYGTTAYGFAAGNYSGTWLAADEINGIRMMNANTTLGKWDTSGVITIGNTVSGHTVISAGTQSFKYGSTEYIKFDSTSGGSAYFNAVVNIATTGEIRQGTGTVGSNFTGIRLFNSSGVGYLAGYNSNVAQWYGDTDGALKAGAGAVVLDAGGIGVYAAGTGIPESNHERSYSLLDTGGAAFAKLSGNRSSKSAWLLSSGTNAVASLWAYNPSNSNEAIVSCDTYTPLIDLKINGTAQLSVRAGYVSVPTSLIAGNYNASGYGGIGAGVTTHAFSPTVSTWITESTLILTGGNSGSPGGYSTIAFHESGQRVDFIRVGAATMTLGYDGGFGVARVVAPGGISTCYNMAGQVTVSATSYGAFIVPIERDAFIGQWTMNAYISTTNNGSNYWQFELRQLNSSSLIVSWNTSGWAANTWGRNATNVSTSIGTSNLGLYVDVVKVGSPGSVQCASMVYMQ